MIARRFTVWSSTLIIAAAFLALFIAGLRPQPVSAGGATGPSVYISTWGSGQISQTTPLTYTGGDILGFTYTGPDTGQWSKVFDAAAAGLNPTGQWKHNINAIAISQTVAVRNGNPNSNVRFWATFTQNQQKDIPGISGWVDGYDIVYWNGYSFTLWFDGEDVGLTRKTQEKIDSLEVMSSAPISSTFAGEDCEAYFLISPQGAGYVPAPPSSGRRAPVIKFRGEDVLGFCATNLGRNTTGFWEMVIDGSTFSPKLAPRDVDSISATGNPALYNGTANRARPYDSSLFEYNVINKTVSGPSLDFATLGITSPVDALHQSATPRR